jgi:hypothetical protein
MDLAARQFLRALRGERSQAVFARRARCQPKSLAAWEAGRRFPTASQALGLAAHDVDVLAAFGRFYRGAAPGLTLDDTGIAAWLERIRGSTPMVEIALRSGYSRFAVARWLSGTARPRLPQFFGLVQAITGRLSDLVSELVPIEAIDAFRDEQEQRERARLLAVEEPWVEAVLRLLETRSGRAHHDGELAERLGIDPELEALCLTRLEAVGIIRRHGAELEVVPLTVHTTRRPEDSRRLKSHWSEVATARIQNPRDEDYLAYNTIALSAADLERVRELLRATFLQIRTIVAESKPERAALVNLQLVAW